jgi:hypothetical protein
MQFSYRVTCQAEIIFVILLQMQLSFGTQNKLDNNLFVAAAEPHPLLHPVFWVMPCMDIKQIKTMNIYSRITGIEAKRAVEIEDGSELDLIEFVSLLEVLV